MIQERFFSRMLNHEVIRVSKKAAERAYNKGKEIYFLPCNLIFDNAWQPATEITNANDYPFNQVCDEFQYYNCDSERGRYIKFYIQTK